MAIVETGPKKPPARHEKIRIQSYDDPAGGWGSVKSVAKNVARERIYVSSVVLAKQNKADGFMCPSCAWAKPAEAHPFEFCENGAKATAWEITPRRAGPDFFAAHSLSELESWPDRDLEETGRLTHPMRWDAESDHYIPVDWEDAFREIGQELKSFDPKSVVFYASGRASLETSYMYALFARLYGNNNLPDSSNMCHESTSVGLLESIGVPVGTVILDDFTKTDCIFFFGQNVGSNAPRMLHDLQEASRRGVPIVVFNPLRERGLIAFTNPQAPLELLSRSETRIASQYHQVKAGGDTAAITGMCKALFALDEDAQSAGKERILDVDFIAGHTNGFGDFEKSVRAYDWQALEQRSGLTRAAMEAAAAVYASSKSVIGIYGMGLTQHRTGVENVQMVINLLLLRGNIGREGAGACPVRGHSNVQGQRTVGITEKPELVPLDALKRQFDFEPPQEPGMNTIEACEAIIAGDVNGFIGLGGNFIRAVPDRNQIEPAWRNIPLTVQIATKLNRNHLVHGKISYLLPCLGRTEIDNQATGPQAVSMEDSTACIHGSVGSVPPASPHLLSEAKIVAEMAKATVPWNAKVDWDRWVGDYAVVRDLIEETYPDRFENFNGRMFQPGGFHRPIAARQRKWNTKSGKAIFIVPHGLSEDIDRPDAGSDVLDLITLRSNDQFNTTIYGYDDRFRGIKGTRMVVLMHRNDIDRLHLKDGDIVALTTAVDDGIQREVGGFRVTPYDIPEGNCGGYYPECNPLIPLWHHAERSKVPAAKAIPIRIKKLSARLVDAVEDQSGSKGAEDKTTTDFGGRFSDAYRDTGNGVRIAGRMALDTGKARPVLSVVIASALIAASIAILRTRSKRRR